MRSRVHMKPKPVGRRFSEDFETQNGLRISFPAVVEVYLQAGGGGGGTYDGFYGNTGDNGSNGDKAIFTLFVQPDPTYDVGAGGTFGTVPAGADPGAPGIDGEPTSFEGEAVTGGVGGLPGGSATSHIPTAPGPNPYFTDSGVPAWPVGSTDVAVTSSSNTGNGGWGVDSAHGGVGGSEAAWRSANARGKKGRIDMIIRG